VGGNWYLPHLVKAQARKLVRAGNLNPENVQDVISGMYGVVNEGGTGHAAALPNVKVCGKTGTAQLASNQVLKGTKLGQSMKDNAWFVGFAPEEAPEIIVVALFESGEHGQYAAPIVRDVCTADVDKPSRGATAAAKLEAPSPPPLLQSPRPVATLTQTGLVQ
jgi:penicillin-binding protein 2